MLKFIAVDLQYDFTRPKGKHYNARRTSVNLVRDILIPFFITKEIKIAEIISDYRQPRPGDLDHSCVPGEWGYVSEIPDKIVETRLIKCMNSPYFTRDNIGKADEKPGCPRHDAAGFYSWLNGYMSNPSDTIVLFGLTLDCCVLCTAQAIRFRGYDVKILMEATDTYWGGNESKHQVMEVVSNWAKPMTLKIP